MLDETPEYFKRGLLVTDEDGFTKNPYGQFQLYHLNYDPIFKRGINGDWSISYDVLDKLKKVSFDFKLANKTLSTSGRPNVCAYFRAFEGNYRILLRWY